CSTFRQSCDMLKNNTADYAVMAIENSLAGSILSNYDLIDEYGLRIIGEQYLKIELHLLALQGVRLQDLECIHSHPMALAQCSDFLARHPWIRVTEERDTASSVKKILEKNLRNTAAVANDSASVLYRVPILIRDIGNSEANYTRFIILSKGDSCPERPNKASVKFRIRHETGSLADVLNVLKRNQVNISKIQSIPIAGEPYEYSFHTDLEWGDYEQFRKAIKKLRRTTRDLSILGEYIKASIG
ncbi:MAG: prephenate dehydratase domain-containing protein, partial [Bacteroidota bacterium]